LVDRDPGGGIHSPKTIFRHLTEGEEKYLFFVTGEGRGVGRSSDNLGQRAIG